MFCVDIPEYAVKQTIELPIIWNIMKSCDVKIIIGTNLMFYTTISISAFH